MSALARLDVDVQEATPQDAVAGSQPHLVARPTTTDEVSAVMRAAAADDLVVVPRGAGTTLGWTPAPARCDLVLDLAAMDRVLEHQAGDLIVAAQACTPVSTLQNAVADTRQRLAIDEVVPGTTVGGLIATNLSGPRRLAYGTTRDLLIGVTVVRPDGVVATSGGKVVKNVAGYDLGKLMTGSHGTLAVITSAYFRLHPTPESGTWVVSEFDSPDEAAPVVTELTHSQLAPAALEVDIRPGGGTTVATLLEGTAVGVAGRAERALTMSGAEASLSDRPPWGQWLPGTDDQPLLKLTCAMSSVTRIARAASDLGLHVRGSAGVGVLYAAAPATVDLTVAVPRLREETRAAGGSAVVMRAAPSGIDAWGPVEGLDLMRAVKHRFDPESRLSPGRFVGGI